MTVLKKIIIGMLFMLSMSHSVYAQKTIRLTNGEWPPWLSEDLKHYGAASRIVTEAFSSEGVEVQYGFFPWKRAFTLGEKGEWDGSVIWIRTPEREETYHFCDPVLVQRRVFYHLKDYPFDWNSIDDLRGVVIGGTLKYTYGEAFDNAEKEGKITVQRVPKDEINFRKLLRGKIQIFPMEPEVATELLQKQFKPEDIQKLTYHSKPLSQQAYHLILSKKYKDGAKMCSLFNQGLQRLKDSKKYDQYIAEALRGEYKK